MARHLLATYRPLQRSYLRINAGRIKRWHASDSKSPKNDISSLAKAFGIGNAAGILGSLAGMGGGFVMIPMMTHMLKLTQHQAHGTSLFAVMATGLAGAVSYSDHVQWESAAAVAVCGMLTARLGAKTTTILSGKALKRALGFLMLIMGPAVPAKAYILEQHAANQTEKDNRHCDKSLPERLMAPAVIGLGSGFLAGLFGVGGGVIVVPALTLATDCTHYQALATSLAAMTLPALAGTMTHYSHGNVALRVAPALALGAFCGGYVGGKLAQKTDESKLRWGFSGLLVFLGIRTIVKA